MWALKDKTTGKLVRTGAKDQWELVRTCYKANGDRFKKIEALRLKSGTLVFRREGVKQRSDISQRATCSPTSH